MKNPIVNHYHRNIALLIVALAMIVTGCGPVRASSTVSPTPSPILTSTATQIPTITPTPTPQPPVAVLLAGATADEAQVSALQTSLNTTITNAGLRWQRQQQLNPSELGPELRLVVALPPDPGLAQLAAQAPQTQFLAMAIPGLPAAPNITSLGADGDRPDQQGFIAGMIAAMLSDDWRVGVISLSDSVAGTAARTGFMNGVVYFCGLCRPAHPPFYEYPLVIELPATASSPEWQEAANYMVDHAAQTVYVFPGAGDEAMLGILASAKVNIISSGAPPEAARSSWVVSLTTDPLPLIQSQVAGLLDGSLAGGRSLTIPIQFTQINPALFTPGKQRLAEQALTDLQAGFIDTGVDLTTGESHP